MTMSTQHTNPYLSGCQKDPPVDAWTRARAGSTLVLEQSGAGLRVDGSWGHADWQRMWHRTQSLDWRTLALVPGDDQTSTCGVANLIARIALDHGESVRVADLRALRPQQVKAFLEGARWETQRGTRIVFATGSTTASPVTTPIARAADCVVLCVSLGTTSLRSIKVAVEQIGRKNFLGSLLVQSPPAGRSRRQAPSVRDSRPKDGA
jgi:hypothetical protein